MGVFSALVGLWKRVRNSEGPFSICNILFEWLEVESVCSLSFELELLFRVNYCFVLNVEALNFILCVFSPIVFSIDCYVLK